MHKIKKIEKRLKKEIPLNQTPDISFYTKLYTKIKLITINILL